MNKKQINFLLSLLEKELTVLSDQQIDLIAQWKKDPCFELGEADILLKDYEMIYSILGDLNYLSKRNDQLNAIERTINFVATIIKR